MLKIPDDPAKLPGWITDITEECMRSASRRRAYYQTMQGYYDRGSGFSERAPFNAIRPTVDRVSGYLYASHSARFRASLAGNVVPAESDMANTFGEILTAEFKRSDADLEFGEAVKVALVKGAALLKMRTDGFGMAADLVDPLSFGVLRESLERIEDQEAICHISRPTISELWEMAGGTDPDRRSSADALVERLLSTPEETEEPAEHQFSILLGSLDPLGQYNEPVDGTGNVSGLNDSAPAAMRPSPARNLRWLTELWVRDPERDGDWTTLQMVFPDVVIVGKYRRRNLFGVQGHTPFRLIQPVRKPGSFFGASIIENLTELQDTLTMKINGLTKKWKRNIDPPTVFSGASGNIPESWDTIEQLGGMVDLGETGKAEPLTTPVSPQELEEVSFLLQQIDRQAGFQAVLMGQGESGVRSGGHAGTLVRTASPPLLRMATRTERQLEDVGYLGSRIIRNADPREYRTDAGAMMRLAQLPEGYEVEVDAHSASPAFADTIRADAELLAQAHAIGAEDLIEMLHPPHAKMMIARLKQREAAAAHAQAEAEALKSHPPAKKKE
jgi:hypothetical protein